MTGMPSPRLFDRATQGWIAARLLALMIASALTEGMGIVLLVPLLAAMQGGGDGRFSAALAKLGMAPRLELILALFVVLVSLRALFNYWQGMAAMRLEYAIVDRLRGMAWQALLKAEWRVVTGMRKAETTSLLITQIDQAGLHVNQAMHALAAAATLGGIGLAALAISPQVTLGAGLAGALVLAAYHGLRRRAGALGEELGRAYARIHSQLGEGLASLRLIKGFDREEAAAEHLANEFRGLRRAQIAYQRDLGHGRVGLQIGGALVLAVLVWAALTRWQVSMITILPMVALFARGLPLLEGLQQTTLNWAHTRPAVRAALDLIERAQAARESHEAAVPPPRLSRAIRLEGVSLRFGEGEAALSEVSCTISAGSLTALVGQSGAGKSTLADLLAGLLQPDAGRVLIDEVELSGAVRQAWRARVAYVQQEPVLFTTTLRENLLWAEPNATEADLHDALDQAAARFVFDLPQGLDTPMGDGGRSLSGGEKQRLMLARALLRKPALLILDEATSALDSENEAQVVEAISRLKGQMTILIIGHRGALLDLADQEIRLVNGKIANKA